ncbi:MAG: LuxR family transcriptional regulator [Verrucomicrobia bacterium]|nr:LuxR family transcriptional regulator [Verrucomicrobiota bacterium]
MNSTNPKTLPKTAAVAASPSPAPTKTAVKRITVVLAEDHHIVREGFRSLLKHEVDIEVVGEAENGRQAIQLIRKLHPEVVVMDIAMPLLNGLEATRQIRKEFPEIKVLILSAHNDDAYVEQMAALGASGFLLKQASAHHLPTAIREVYKGKTFFTASVSKRVLDRHNKSLDRGEKGGNRLSSREMEVLQMIAEGKPNKQVAAELGVSFKTVDKHRQHLMSKLDIHDVAGLTRYAISEGIIESTVRLTIL